MTCKGVEMVYSKMLIGKGRWKTKWRIWLYAKHVRLEDGNEGKIKVNTYLEGWREDGENVNEGIHEGI